MESVRGAISAYLWGKGGSHFSSCSLVAVGNLGHLQLDIENQN